jgi:hypothetical protein
VSGVWYLTYLSRTWYVTHSRSANATLKNRKPISFIQLTLAPQRKV